MEHSIISCYHRRKLPRPQALLNARTHSARLMKSDLAEQILAGREQNQRITCLTKTSSKWMIPFLDEDNLSVAVVVFSDVSAEDEL